jgi:P27 family predicted phage terminase small subunit
VRRPTKPELRVVGELDVPDPPRRLLRATRAWWFAYWHSDVAKAVQADTDIPSLARLATLIDERERTYRLIRKRKSGVVAEGSQGQDVLHPLAKYLQTCDAEIRALEDRFGLNPRARVSLGLQLTHARREIEDLYRDVELEDKGDAPESLVVDLAQTGRNLPRASN